jgi:hypothetical protein
VNLKASWIAFVSSHPQRE